MQNKIIHCTVYSFHTVTNIKTFCAVGRRGGTACITTPAPTRFTTLKWNLCVIETTIRFSPRSGHKGLTAKRFHIKD